MHCDPRLIPCARIQNREIQLAATGRNSGTKRTDQSVPDAGIRGTASLRAGYLCVRMVTGVQKKGIKRSDSVIDWESTPVRAIDQSDGRTVLRVLSIRVQH